MIVGFDYWQVISHYPDKIGHLMFILKEAMPDDEVHVISAIGKTRVGTIKGEVYKSLNDVGWGVPKWCVKPENIHEVVFDNPSQSPELKLAKCQELGIEMFFDDRDDVCRLLNQHGIVAMRVTRKDNSKYDLEAER
jgi:hypothetical protein